jgi:hypothetical protein
MAGATVEAFTLSGGDQIAAIKVGEVGRGRKLGILPVRGDAPDKPYTLESAEIGMTRNGNPRLIFKPVTDDSAAIVVMRTSIGYRGGNAHTGDRTGTKDDGTAAGFAPFPARQILARGIIAQGAAGAMGSGEQMIGDSPGGVLAMHSERGGAAVRQSPHEHHEATPRQAIAVHVEHVHAVEAQQVGLNRVTVVGQ